jgi:hypothetical protein
MWVIYENVAVNLDLIRRFGIDDGDLKSLLFDDGDQPLNLDLPSERIAEREFRNIVGMLRTGEEAYFISGKEMV